MYTRERNAASPSPIEANQLKRVLPAVHAKGLPAGPSLAPGAWPTSITGETTGSPVTTGGTIPGQRRHWLRRAWCRRIAVPGGSTASCADRYEEAEGAFILETVLGLGAGVLLLAIFLWALPFY